MCVIIWTIWESRALTYSLSSLKQSKSDPTDFGALLEWRSRYTMQTRGLHAWPCFLCRVIRSHPPSHTLHSNYPDFFHFLKSIALPSIIDLVCADLSLKWGCLTLTPHHYPLDFISPLAFSSRTTSSRKPYTSPFPIWLRIPPCICQMSWTPMFTIAFLMPSIVLGIQ